MSYNILEQLTWLFIWRRSTVARCELGMLCHEIAVVPLQQPKTVVCSK